MPPSALPAKIEKQERKIEKYESEIEAVEAALAGGPSYLGITSHDVLPEKKKQLRDEMKQLRHEMKYR